MERNKAERRRAGREISVMKVRDQISDNLVSLLGSEAQLIEQLNHGVHHTDLTYAEVVRQFVGSNEDLQSQVNNPFVVAFEYCSFCEQEDVQFLEKMRHYLASADVDSELLRPAFEDWFSSQLGIISAGFQTFVLEAGIIAPLSAEKAREKTMAGRKRWNAQNPELAAEVQRKAAQAAKEAAKPSVYTQEHLELVQALLNQMNPEATVGILKILGHKTSYSSLLDAIDKYGLTNVSEEKRREERDIMDITVRRVFEETGSVAKTKRILGALYSDYQLKYALSKQVLRERVDWDAYYEIEGQAIKLEEVVASFSLQKYDSIQDEYQAFMDFLKENGVEESLTINSYRAKKKRMAAMPKGDTQ